MLRLPTPTPGSELRRLKRLEFFTVKGKGSRLFMCRRWRFVEVSNTSFLFAANGVCVRENGMRGETARGISACVALLGSLRLDSLYRLATYSLRLFGISLQLCFDQSALHPRPSRLTAAACNPKYVNIRSDYYDFDCNKVFYYLGLRCLDI